MCENTWEQAKKKSEEQLPKGIKRKYGLCQTHQDAGQESLKVRKQNKKLKDVKAEAERLQLLVCFQAVKLLGPFVRGKLSLDRICLMS